jgi:hypothetical protein
MAVKADFTEAEWSTLKHAMLDTMTYLSVVDPGFWDTLKEAGHASRFIAGEAGSSASLLVRDLAHDVRGTKDADRSLTPANIETPTLEAVTQAAAIVAEKAPEDLEAFRSFILGIAETVADADKDVVPAEMHAIEKIRAALG